MLETEFPDTRGSKMEMGTRTKVVVVRLPDTSRSRMRTRGEELGHRATAIARKSCVDIDTD